MITLKDFRIELRKIDLEALDHYEELHIQGKAEQSSFMTAIVAMLKLLVWCVENLFDEKGKLSIPIWKWPKVMR